MQLPKQLLQRKPVDALTAAENSLKRTLTAKDLTLLGVGAIIGAGIFVLTGIAAAKYAGPAIVMSFVLAGIACALAALCYSEMASMIPVSGSAYSYAYATLGELMAWIIGWDLVLEYALASSTVAIGWAGYLLSFLQPLGLNLPPSLTTAYLADPAAGFINLPAVLIVLMLTALLVVGIRQSAVFNFFMVVIKLAVIVAFILAGMGHVDSTNWADFAPFGFGGILTGAGVIFFAYIGFDAVSTTAQEAINPQKDVPFGIIASLAICTVLYILVAGVLTGVIAYDQLNVAAPIALAVDHMGMIWLSPIIKIGAIAGLTSVMLVLLMGQSRIFFTMAKDGLLPPLFAQVHDDFKTPHRSTLMVGVAVALLAGFMPIEKLGELVSIGTLFAFVLVCAGVLVLRSSHPEMERQFRCPAVPWVPLAGIVVCLVLMAGLPLDTWMRLLAWLAIGFVIYFRYGIRHSRLQTSD
ncbi:MAG: amino acid permease [Methylomonas sp.]|nr:amino acid permease [Methylomonas sp.]PPD22606.1 MAG: amino acid permease [Methylomonas sp.]PPD27916.1 MAG: amino acid permease [Methylomonas sp.]PPD40026.1 MAG: amino acid permease [Methylomonas sp.]PPD41586.1 MAG: amino acid permease [Methylomonas sp.]